MGHKWKRLGRDKKEETRWYVVPLSGNIGTRVIGGYHDRKWNKFE